MIAPLPDPYAILGVSGRATEVEIRAAYRRAVQREHPDHNGGSAEAARRFETVQEAYAQIRLERARSAAGTSRQSASAAGTSRQSASAAGTSRQKTPAAGASTTSPDGTSGSDADVEARLAALERELARARQARERAIRAAREAAADAIKTERKPGVDNSRRRATDEELGYYSTDDSLGQIFSDAAEELKSDAREHRVPKPVSDLVDDARERRVPKRLSDLIDELGSKLTGEPPER